MAEITSPSFPRRLIVLVYDSFLVLPLIMLVVAIATGVQIAVTGDESAGDYSATLHPLLVQSLAVLTLVAFYGTFWRMRGQTLGMQAWRIRLRNVDGGPILLRQVLLRCVGAALSLGLLGAGFWWCLIDRHGRYWHDYISKTELELIAKAGN